ncbi:BTB domain-containing protein [Aphelenchoides besseyi]|nr:BTB domain-containing protein [Aphelenchoides besseyi]
MDPDDYFRHPNVALWRIDNFAQLFRNSIQSDQWCSGPFVLKVPGVPEFSFELATTILQHDENKTFDVCVIVADTYINWDMDMECETWIEDTTGKRSEIKKHNICLSASRPNDSFPAFSFDDIGKFLNREFIFLCCRFPHVVKSTLSVSLTWNTFRWTIDKFTPTFKANTKVYWESDVFQFDGAKFQLLLLRRNVYSHRGGQCYSCFALHATDLGGRTSLWCQTELWVESNNERAKKNELSEFSPALFCTYTTYSEFRAFVADRPLLIHFKIYSIVPKSPKTKPPTMEKFFDNPNFCDGQIEVGERVFKISRMVVCIKSNFFMELFSKASVVKIEEFEAEKIEVLLRYMYGGKFEGDAYEFLPVAYHFKVYSLIKQCTDSIIDNLSTEKIVKALELAFRFYQLSDFKIGVMLFACKNQKRLAKMLAFKEMVSKSPIVGIQLLEIGQYNSN